MNTDRNYLMLRQAYELAKQSPDPSTQNGVLLINHEGQILCGATNNFPCGIANRPERLERELKYRFVEHAERAVIYQAARLGIKTEHLIMICPWMPCCDCARAVIEAGINTLVTHKQINDRTPERWKADQALVLSMLEESSVNVVVHDGVIGVTGVRFNGELWNP